MADDTPGVPSEEPGWGEDEAESNVKSDTPEIKRYQLALQYLAERLETEEVPMENDEGNRFDPTASQWEEVALHNADCLLGNPPTSPSEMLPDRPERVAPGQFWRWRDSGHIYYVTDLTSEMQVCSEKKCHGWELFCGINEYLPVEWLTNGADFLGTGKTVTIKAGEPEVTPCP
jgi:hypothetical protein